MIPFAVLYPGLVKYLRAAQFARGEGYPCGNKGVFIPRRNNCWTHPKTGQRLKKPLTFKLYKEAKEKSQRSKTEKGRTALETREQSFRDKAREKVKGWQKNKENSQPDLDKLQKDLDSVKKLAENIAKASPDKVNSSRDNAVKRDYQKLLASQKQMEDAIQSRQKNKPQEEIKPTSRQSGKEVGISIDKGFHIRDTLVDKDKFNQLPEEQKQGILDLKKEFEGLGYIDARTQVGPSQSARQSQNQRDKIAQTASKAFEIESKVKWLTKTPEEQSAIKSQVETKALQKELDAVKNSIKTNENFLSHKLTSPRDNLTKREHQKLLNRQKELEETLQPKQKPQAEVKPTSGAKKGDQSGKWNSSNFSPDDYIKEKDDLVDGWFKRGDKDAKENLDKWVKDSQKKKVKLTVPGDVIATPDFMNMQRSGMINKNEIETKVRAGRELETLRTSYTFPASLGNALQLYESQKPGTRKKFKFEFDGDLPDIPSSKKDNFNAHLKLAQFGKAGCCCQMKRRKTKTNERVKQKRAARLARRRSS